MIVMMVMMMMILMMMLMTMLLMLMKMIMMLMFTWWSPGWPSPAKEGDVVRPSCNITRLSLNNSNQFFNMKTCYILLNQCSFVSIYLLFIRYICLWHFNYVYVDWHKTYSLWQWNTLDFCRSFNWCELYHYFYPFSGASNYLDYYFITISNIIGTKLTLIMMLTVQLCWYILHLGTLWVPRVFHLLDTSYLLDKPTTANHP